MDANGICDADGVCELHLGNVGQSRRNQVLGDISGQVACRSVDLGRILAAERPAAVATAAALGVDDDLAAGKPGVAVRPAD